MAYNKSKHVETAQKLLNQGKVPQAIAEYQNILKQEPRDQVTLMTIGELYIRQGETFQAIDYFERLAQIFVGDGFLTKAIAVYKRIAKLAPEEIRPLEKLADLYVQQGVMSEARPIFLQLAEIHLKNNRQSEAVALLKKLLAAEPDNLRIQIRLADLYQAMGQKKEAVEAYVDAAQRLLARGDHPESEKIADKALKIEPGNVAGMIVKARLYAAQGKVKEAVEQLEQVPDLQKGGEQAELLLDLYLKNAKWEEATSLASRTFEADEKNFGPAQKTAEALLRSEQGERALSLIAQIRLPMIENGEHDAISHLLNELAAQMPERIEPREWLVDTYGRTSDSFRMADALANLGDALVAAGKLERAKEVYSQLADREPESEPARRKLNDVLRKLGLLPVEEPQAMPVEDLQTEIAPAPAPRVRPDPEAPETVAAQPVSPTETVLDTETQRFIAQSLTDVDLFASYGLTHKAAGLLEAILRRAPRHTQTLERLLDFLLGANDYRRIAEVAALLEQIHHERGDERSAERFGELRRRFQRAANLTAEELNAADVQVAAPAPPAQEAIPAAEMQPAPPPVETAPPAREAHAEAAPAEVQEEVDLSDEWAALLEGATAGEPHAGAGQPGAPESQEHAAPKGRPEAVPEKPEFHVPVEAPPPEHVSHTDVEISPEIPGSLETAGPVVSETAPGSSAPVSEQSKAAVPEAPCPAEERPALEIEPVFELDQDYELVLDAEPLVPAHEQIAPAPAMTIAPHDGENLPAAPISAEQFLADLASEIDHLEISGTGTERAESPAPALSDAAAVSSPVESGPLKEVFDEFRAELGEMAGEDEDLETHYNLGIAFREMGLLEEAISEFQKVAKANDRGRAFRYAMQCCTLLGLAFMEKGQSGIAAHWYERALQTPGIDPESTLALRYDLGVAQESAGDFDAALKSFIQVYAVNIDYRDVAERIAALEKAAR